MAQPTNVTITYRRQVQPAQYESEVAELTGAFTIEDGEDFEQVAYDALTRARVQAHRVLGRKEPEVAEFAPAFGWLSDPQSGEEAGAVIEAPTNGEEKPRRKRRTKAEMEAARAAESNPTPAAAVDMTAAVAVTEDESQPANGSDIDFDITEPVKEITGEQLQTAAAAKARALGANGAQMVKKLMAEYQVARLGELAQEKRQAFLARLDALTG